MIRQKAIFCYDGCSGIRAWYDNRRPGMNEFFYISWYEDGFYGEQNRISMWLEKRWKYLTGDFVIGELYTDRQTLKEFLAWLKRLPELSTEKALIYSTLMFQLEPLNDTPMKYRVTLRGKLSKRAILLGKYFSMFDMKLNEIEKQSIISKLEAVLR